MRIIEKYLKVLKSSEHEIIQSMYNSKYKIEDIEDCKELFIFASKNFEDKYEVAKTRNALNNINLELDFDIDCGCCEGTVTERSTSYMTPLIKKSEKTSEKINTFSKI